MDYDNPIKINRKPYLKQYKELTTHTHLSYNALIGIFLGTLSTNVWPLHHDSGEEEWNDNSDRLIKYALASEM